MDKIATHVATSSHSLSLKSEVNCIKSSTLVSSLLLSWKNKKNIYILVHVTICVISPLRAYSRCKEIDIMLVGEKMSPPLHDKVLRHTNWHNGSVKYFLVFVAL